MYLGVSRSHVLLVRVRDSRNRLEISRRGSGARERIQMFYFLRIYSHFGSAFILLPPLSLSLPSFTMAVCVCWRMEARNGYIHAGRNAIVKAEASVDPSAHTHYGPTHACSAMHFMTFHLKPEQASRAGGKGWEKITEKFSLRA